MMFSFPSTWFGYQHRRIASMILVGLIALVCITAAARAQVPPPPAPIFQPGDANRGILQDVGIDQKLGSQVPADLQFVDENGKTVHLGDYYGKRPIILTLVYYECPMLCTMVLNDLVRTMNSMPLQLGKDFDIVTISFDPRESTPLAQAKRKQYLAQLNKHTGDQGWHFLTGSPDSIAAVTQAVGFRYAWDAKQKLYAHASGIMILTPGGATSRYFFGIDYVENDLRLALDEASGGRIGTLTDTVLQFCYQYDPATGKYGARINLALKIGGALTILAMGSFIGLMLRRERHPAESRLTGQQHSGIDEP